MDNSPLQLAMSFTLEAEKGYTDDDGGPTMYGVTQAVYDAYRDSIHAPRQSVRLISMSEVATIMFAMYWQPAQCSLLPTKVAIAHFDTAYNEGVHGAIEILQTALGVVVDGSIGPQTKHAIEIADPVALLDDYLDDRRSFYHRLSGSDPDRYSSFLTGWLNRVNELETYLENINV